MSVMLKRQIILSNRISWATLPLLFGSMGLAWVVQEYALAFGFLLFSGLLAGVFGLNYFYKTLYSRVLLSILPTLVTIFFPVIEVHNTEHYSAVLLGSVVFCVYPFLLIDYSREKSWFILVSTLNLMFITGYDIAYSMLSDDIHWTISDWLLIKVPQVFMFLIIASGFIFMQKMNIQYERHLENMNQVLAKSHQVLAEKNEEIEAQKSQILAQNQKIIHQNTLLKIHTKDITAKNEELETGKETLKQNKEEIQAILETLAVREAEITAVLDAIYIHAPITEFDLMGNILNISYKTAQIFDVKRHELIGKNITQFERSAKTRTPEEIEKVRQFWQNLTQGNAQTRESELVVNRKHIHFAETFAPILDGKGNPHKIISVGQDVTQIYRQKNKIEEQNLRIRESIRAALLIQRAVLPDEERMEELLGDYFLIYHPKDVVSGDFYRVDKVENTVLLTVADCTGHGVPGAFMTMIGSLLLNEIIHMDDVVEPAQILWAMHESVKVALRQKDTGDRNGMDMSILALQKSDKNRFRLRFAGAKHHLTCITETGEMQIIKGTRKSIGGRQNEQKHFTSQSFMASPKSMIYLTTDGLIDQNNLLNRERFGREQFLELLQQVAPLPILEQQKQIERSLYRHMQGTAQRDDILTVGVRL